MQPSVTSTTSVPFSGTGYELPALSDSLLDTFKVKDKQASGFGRSATLRRDKSKQFLSKSVFLSPNPFFQPQSPVMDYRGCFYFKVNLYLNLSQIITSWIYQEKYL